MSVGGSGSQYLDVVLMWPLVDIKLGKAGIVPGALSVGAAYWWGGGWPMQGQSVGTTVQAYLLGGLVTVVYLYRGVLFGSRDLLRNLEPHGPRTRMHYGPGPSIHKWDPPM